MCKKNVVMETKTDRIRRKLEKDGWHLARDGSGHDISRPLSLKGIITLPRYKTVSLGVARSIAKKAGWPE